MNTIYSGVRRVNGKVSNHFSDLTLKQFSVKSLNYFNWYKQNIELTNFMGIDHCHRHV